MASRLLTRLAQAAAVVVLARVLSPEGFGIYGALTSTITLAVTLGNLGLRQAAAWRIGQNQMTPGQAAATLSVLWLPLSVLAMGGVALALGPRLGAQGPGVLISVVLAVAGGLYVTLIQGVNLGRQQVKVFGLTDAGPRVIQAVAVGGLALLGLLTLSSALWTFTLGFLLVAPVAVFFAIRGGGRFVPRLAETPRMVRYGLLFAVSMFIITLQSRLGVLILERMGDPGAAGQFFAAQRMNEILLEVATAFGLVLFSQTVRAPSFRDSLAMAFRPAIGLFVLFVALAAGTALFAPLVARMLLGAAYADIGPLIQVLALGLPAAAFVKIMNGVVAGGGKPILSASVVGAGLVVNLVLAVLLVPAMGAMGSAWALVAALYMAMAVYVGVGVAGYGVEPVAVARQVLDGVRSRLSRKA